jgi:hypothetical protein
MIALSFASQCNRFAGQVGWVVGRGPTRFRYEALGQAEGPIFFINDAVGQEIWTTERQSTFFFAHDAVMECWLFSRRLKSIPVLIADQPLTGPDENRKKGLISGIDDSRLAALPRAIFYRKNGPFEKASLLSRGREELRNSGQLLTRSGTIHPLLHFAWYVGCSKLNLVGCDGFPDTGYDGRLDNRSQSRQQSAMTIRCDQEEMLRQLALPAEYLGTIPHRIEMMLELKVSRESHGGFLEWARALIALYRKHGCGELTARDLITPSGGYWIKGVWPGMEACVECLISPEFKHMTRDALAPFVSDPRESLQVAYRAVRI